MSITGLAIIYIIIWWIVFFVILPIDVKRTKTVKIDGEDPGSPDNPKMLKKFLYCTGITTVILASDIRFCRFSQDLLNERHVSKRDGEPLVYLNKTNLNISHLYVQVICYEH